MHTNGTAATPETIAPQAEASGVEAGIQSSDAGGPAPSHVAAAVLNLRAAISDTAEARHDQSTPKGQLIVALAKHLARIYSDDVIPADYACMQKPAHVAKDFYDIGGSMVALWELFVPEAEQAVKLLCMEWRLGAEVLKVQPL